MQAEKLAKYLTQLKNKTGLSYEAIGNLCDKPESTVKNLCNGKTDNPGIDTVAPVIYALGGSLDEMYNPEMTKDEVKETAVISIKDGYEHQMSLLKEAYDEQINNIRTHYEQHHNDLKENFEKRLSDKLEIIEIQKNECKLYRKAFWACGFILIALLIAEVMNPSLGWFRY